MKIITSGVTDPTVQQPFTTASLQFLQNAILATDGALALNTYSPAQSVLSPRAFGSGCRRTGNAISSGWFYGGAFNPGLYYLEAHPDVSAFVNPPLCRPAFGWATTGGTFPFDVVADPLLHTDNIYRNVHQISRFIIADEAIGGAPSGSFLYSSLQFGSYSATTATATFTGTTSCLIDNNTGIVHLKGMLGITTGASASICTLPVGYRPTAEKRLSVNFYDDGQYTSGVLILDTAGGMTPSVNWSGSLVRGVNLDGLSFYVGW